MTVPTASAQGSLLLVESDSYVSIDENSAHEKVILGYVVSQNPENILEDNFRVHGALSGLNVYDEEGELPFSVENIENEWRLIRYTLRDTLMPGDRSDVTVEFTKAVENIGGNLMYKISYKWNILPTSYQVIAKLPKGSSLVSTSENTSELYTENDSLYLRYSGVMRDSFQTYIVFTAQAPAQPPEEAQIPEEGQQAEGDQTLLLYVVLVIAVVASPLAVWAIRRIRRAKPPVKAPKRVPEAILGIGIEKILSMLHENERKIVEVLLQEDNLTQAELCGRTGIPRATMSRILAGLEQKDIVKRSEYGMSKKVILSRWVKEGKRRSQQESET